MSRYLMCLLLVLLAGCVTGDRGGFSSSNGFLEAPGDENGSIDPFGEDLAEEDLVGEDTALLDPLTREDMDLLSGEDQAPPEDEGETAVEEGTSFDLPVVKNAKVRYFLDYFTGTARNAVHRWLERSTRYLPMMREVFAEEGLPLDLTYLAMIESGFNSRAVSRAKAVGPWQFMEGTGRMYGLENDWWHDERRDPYKATRAAARHLRDLYNRYEDWYLAIAAYNAGAGRVDRAIVKAGTRDFWEISHGSFLAKETQHYLPKLMAAILISKNPEKYGFNDLNYQPALATDVVELPSSTDLEIIARLVEVTEEEVRDLNPELKRWCTPPNKKGYPVRLPSGTAESFKRQYAEISPSQRANFQQHRVRSGDTLTGLARRYGITTKDIVRLNNIRNPRALRVGQDLILPMQAGAALASIYMDSVPSSKPSSYKVRNGDNLWSISRRLGVTTKQLCDWNDLRSKAVLRPGQVLKVHGSNRHVAAKSAQSSYKVRNGDNLWVISRRFGMSTSQLCSLNGLGANDILKPGQVLKVSGKASGRDVSSSQSIYQVANGDNLWTISQRLGVSTSQLCEWNGLQKNDILKPGQVLQIREVGLQSSVGTKKVVYQVRPGDTVWEIGRRYDLKARDIMDWNNLNHSHVIQPGDQLTLLLEEEQKG
ncbi:MAG: LysM peptidoglycan-binding domain-containing protein [Syntrophotaleaceae bacterium]